MSSIKHIFNRNNLGENVEYTDILLSDDAFQQKDKARQISLISEEGYQEIKGGTHKGFCHLKFKGNLVIDGDFPGNLEKNDTIEIKDAVVAVTNVGKECHKSCPHLENKYPCNLQKSIVFGFIKKKGVIKKGDAISIRKAAKLK